MTAESVLFASVVGGLESAWQSILARQEESSPSVGVSRFEQDAERRLERLQSDLISGTYRPGNLHQILIPKSDGSFRALAVPTVADRIVERALLTTITPHVDPWLGAASYAYRPGIGVADAVQAVARHREAGMDWVLRADIEDCFETVPRKHALRLLLAVLPDDSLHAVLTMMLERRVSTPHGLREVSGVPQGTSLSPLMSNLVLVRMDNALLDRGFALVRFADDFTVVCDSANDAWEAARTATGVLQELNMNLSPAKTEVMSFEDGFCFLGEDFGPRYPPVLAEHRIAEPDLRVVYVALQGSRVIVSRGRLHVESRDDEKILDVPISLVARVICFGSVGVSAGVRAWALSRGIDVVFLSRRGSYQGQLLAGNSNTRVARLRAQIEVSGDRDRVLGFAREVIDTKIRHQITVIQRFGRRDRADDIAELVGRMRAMTSLLPASETTEEVMGLEGAAARSYFEALGLLLPADMGFEGRSRRPPTDVVNAALGYGYAVLLGECVSAIVAAGLDPAFGFLHSESGQRPSLALDLMEEFRPLIVDQVVVALARRGALTADHGQRRESDPGVWLTKAGKSILTDAYERRMLQITSGALPGFSGSLRRHVYRQAERLAGLINGDTNEWTGLSWR